MLLFRFRYQSIRVATFIGIHHIFGNMQKILRDVYYSVLTVQLLLPMKCVNQDKKGGFDCFAF